MSKFPTSDKYLAAMQNPGLAFTDPELKQCAVETDMHGLPRPFSGGFVLACHLMNGKSEFAVRCFYKDIRDLKLRYKAIGEFLSKNNTNGIFVLARLLEEGIRVERRLYPIIKMQWVKGDSLGLYVEKNVFNKARMRRLSAEFVKLVQKLEGLHIAHGDLQHLNIIVINGKPVLIDYDDMYLRELAALGSNGKGHPNYQHPARTADHFNSRLDRFPAIVVYLALEALIYRPDLWQKYCTGENMLFVRDDFQEPSQSSLLAEIESIPELKHHAERFRGVCMMEFEDIPSLDEFIAGRFSCPRVSRASGSLTVLSGVVQYDRVNAFNIAEVRRKSGRRVEAIGYVTNVHTAADKYGRQYAILFLKSTKEACLALTIWPRTLELFKKRAIDPAGYVRKWVSVTGVIFYYGDKLQLEVIMPSEIRVLADKSDAMGRLDHSAAKPESKRWCPAFMKTWQSSPCHPGVTKAPAVKRPPIRSSGPTMQKYRPVPVRTAVTQSPIKTTRLAHAEHQQQTFLQKVVRKLKQL